MHSNLRRVLIEAKEDLAEQCCQPIALADIAKLSGYSQFHFHREFSQLFGQTPAAFVRELRIAKAKKLLIKGDCSINEICAEIGYSSRTTFSREFARLNGEPPSEFRRVFAAGGIWRLKLIPSCFVPNRKF